jgi:hypothetical protein
MACTDPAPTGLLMMGEDVAHLHDAEDAGEGDGGEQEHDCNNGVGTHR